ncbi:DUF397 domain-containing protein [Nocardiopsis sp. NPDC057823]|uniref:DUF397 domain-containing protein n=1 Tax=Nocardiopsis sp. NPDC057823 TaxID=3346256 RepID=UPI00366D4CC2
MNETWKKSTYSPNGSDCVECRYGDGAAGMRDTKNRDAGHLTFGPSEWVAALAAQK